jgi:hypothetical protein
VEYITILSYRLFRYIHTGFYVKTVLWNIFHFSRLQFLDNEVNMKNLKAWLRAASTEEREQLAKASGASVSYLYQLAKNDEDPAERNASAKMATAIEQAAAPITLAAGGRLPTLLRTDLCEACMRCEFAQQILGDAAIAAHFRFVEPTETKP